MNGAPHISAEDLALYAMQALEPGELAAVRAHLQQCAHCRAELREIEIEMALVALSAPVEAMPKGAEQRLMARIANIAQDHPAAAATEPGIAPRREAVPESRTRAGFGFGWFGWATAVAAIAVAAYLGNRNVQLQQAIVADRSDIVRLSAQADRAQMLTDALTSPEAKQVTLTETKQAALPTGHATYLASKGSLVFVASNLHPLKADKTYELWLLPADGKAPIPAGLFRPDASGSASVILPDVPSGIHAKGFGVTIEDAQGASTPTLPIVMSGF